MGNTFATIKAFAHGFMEAFKEASREFVKAEETKIVRFAQRSTILEQAAVGFYITATIKAVISIIKRFINKKKGIADTHQYMTFRLPSDMVGKTLISVVPTDKKLFEGWMDQQDVFARAGVTV